MDIERSDLRRKRRYRNWAGIGASAAGACVLGLLGWAFSGRPPAVESDKIWRGTVARGDLIREVSASGTLAAREIREVTTRTEGVVERVLALPGQAVTPDTVLLDLSSPQLQDDLEKARLEKAAGEADFRLAQIDADNHARDIEADLASAQSAYTGSILELQAKQQIPGIVPQLDIERMKLKTDELQVRLKAEKARSETYRRYRSANDASGRAKLEQLRDKVAQLERQVSDLHVRAGSTGVVKEMNAQQGQRVAVGEAVAEVVNPTNLVARLDVSEREAGLVKTGMPVQLEIGTDTLKGKVVRIDPAVHNQLVTVDAELAPDSTASLRPDLSVTARIELGRVSNALVLDRPVGVRREFQTIDLYVVQNDGATASRRSVEVGRASARQVEIVRGLRAGDQVILSDLSDLRSQPVIRLH